MMQLFDEGKDVYITVLQIAYPHLSMDEIKAKRKRIKSVVLGAFYGRGNGSIAASEHMTIEEVVALREAFFNKFKQVDKMIKRKKNYCAETGMIQTILGDRTFSDKNRAATVGFNGCIQGTSAVMLAESFYNNVRKGRAVGVRTSIISVVHDSNMIRVPIKDMFRSYLAIRKFYKQYFWDKYRMNYAYDLDIQINLRDSIKFKYEPDTGMVSLNGTEKDVNYLVETIAKYHKIEILEEAIDEKGKSSFYSLLKSYAWKSHRYYPENNFRVPNNKSVSFKLLTPYDEIYEGIEDYYQATKPSYAFEGRGDL